MDDFLTPAERDLRRSARELFRPRNGSAAGGAGPGAGPSGFEGLFKELGFRGRGQLERALIVEEAAAASPDLARALLESAPAGAGAAAWNLAWTPGTASAAMELAWNLGTASAAIEVGLAAARDRGLFQSALMGHQKVQGELADALTAVRALRLRAYRALRLVDAGRTGRGTEELGLAAAEAAAVRDRTLAVVGALLGGPGPQGSGRE